MCRSVSASCSARICVDVCVLKRVACVHVCVHISRCLSFASGCCFSSSANDDFSFDTEPPSTKTTRAGRVPSTSVPFSFVRPALLFFSLIFSNQRTPIAEVFPLKDSDPLVVHRSVPPPLVLLLPASQPVPPSLASLLPRVLSSSLANAGGSLPSSSLAVPMARIQKKLSIRHYQSPCSW